MAALPRSSGSSELETGGTQPNNLKPESQSRTFFSSSLMLDFLFWEFRPRHSFVCYLPSLAPLQVLGTQGPPSWAAHLPLG